MTSGGDQSARVRRGRYALVHRVDLKGSLAAVREIACGARHSILVEERLVKEEPHSYRKKEVKELGSPVGIARGSL